MIVALLILVSLETAEAPWWNYPGLELWKFFNLLVFVAVGVYVLRRPLTDALGTRRESIKRDLVRARQERDTALAKLEEVEERLGRLDAEVAAIRENAKQEAASERQRIEKSTEAEISKLHEDVRREIAATSKAARQELRIFAAAESVKLAEEIIRREIRADDDVRLIGHSVEELGRFAK